MLCAYSYRMFFHLEVGEGVGGCTGIGGRKRTHGNYV